MDVALLAPGEMVDRFPWLGIDGLALGSLGLHEEGWFDGYAFVQAFRRKARSLGAGYLTAEATAIRVAADA